MKTETIQQFIANGAELLRDKTASLEIKRLSLIDLNEVRSYQITVKGKGAEITANFPENFYMEVILQMVMQAGNFVLTFGKVAAE